MTPADDPATPRADHGRCCARPIDAGDLSGLATGEGRPHDDTADGLAMAGDSGCPPGWLIAVGGTVNGESGTHGPVDA
jgi:hypothetical protein